MPQSRVIRMSFLVLFLGVGLWCGIVLPALFSQEGTTTSSTSVAIPYRPGTGTLQVAQQSSGSAAPDLAPGADPGLDPGAGFGQAADGAVAPGALGAGDPLGGEGEAGATDAADRDPFWGRRLNGQLGAGSVSGGPPMMMGGGMGMASPGMMGPGMGSGMMAANPFQAEEIKLARNAKVLLSKYATETRPEVKEKIKSQLRSVLHQQFRLQHQRRDSELARIERHLADLRSRLKKRADAQSTIVDRRLEQLVNDVDGLGWNAEEVPDNLFNDAASSMMGGRGMLGIGSMSMPGGKMGESSMSPMPPGGTPAGPAGRAGGGEDSEIGIEPAGTGSTSAPSDSTEPAPAAGLGGISGAGSTAAEGAATLPLPPSGAPTPGIPTSADSAE